MQKMIVLAICLSLSACSFWTKPNYKIDTGFQVHNKRILPVTIQSVNASVDENNLGKIINHYALLNGRSKQIEPHSEMREALQFALKQAFEQTQLFSKNGERLVDVNAVFLSFDSRDGFYSYGKVKILYQFIDVKTKNVIYQTEISSMGHEMNLLPMGGIGENDARNDAVANNIQKLLRELSDEKKNAPFFSQPNN